MAGKDAKRPLTLITDVRLADEGTCQLPEEKLESEPKKCLVGNEEWQVLVEDWQSSPAEAQTAIIG